MVKKISSCLFEKVLSSPQSIPLLKVSYFVYNLAMKNLENITQYHVFEIVYDSNLKLKIDFMTGFYH